MKISYPRFFSLSTINLIHHGTTDYFIHPTCTEFNGESGAGKSLIADFLQLLLVTGHNQAYQSSTKTTSEPRRIGGTVLSDSRFGYVFANVEVEANAFIVIGAYIERSSDSPRMFIGQSDRDFDNDNALKPLPRPILSGDLTGDNKVKNVDDCLEDLRERNIMIAKVLSPRKYHSTLYRNQILSFDPSYDEGQLRDYSRVIQSFSNAKNINTHGEKIKHFLFNDGKEQAIIDKYRSKCEEISSNIEIHRYNSSAIAQIKDKSTDLIRLKELLDQKLTSQKDLIRRQTIFHASCRRITESDRDKAEQKLKDCDYGLSLIQGLQHYSKVVSCERLIKKNEEQQEKFRFHNSKVEELRKKMRIHEEAKTTLDGTIEALRPRWRQLAELEQWLLRYGAVGNIKAAWLRQAMILRDRQTLKDFDERLKESALIPTWDELAGEAGDIRELHRLRLSRETILKELLQQLSLAKEFMNYHDPHSLVHWSLDQNRPLSLQEESLLVHFQALKTLKTPKTEHVSNPEKLFLLKNISFEAEGFWFEREGISEYIPYVAQQILATSDRTELLEFLDSNLKAIKQRISEVDKRLTLLQDLGTLYLGFGDPQRLLDLLARRESLLTFEMDKSFPGDEELLDENLTLETSGLALQLKEQKKNLEEEQKKIANDIFICRVDISTLNTEIETIKEILKSFPKSIEDDLTVARNSLKDIRDNRSEFEPQAHLTIAHALANLYKLDILRLDKAGRELWIREASDYDLNKLQNDFLFRAVIAEQNIKSDIDAEKTKYANRLPILAEAEDKSLRMYLAVFQEDFILADPTPKFHWKACESEIAELDRIFTQENSDYFAWFQVLAKPYLATASLPLDAEFSDLVRQMLPRIFSSTDIVDSTFMGRISTYLDEINRKNQEISRRKIDILLDVFNEVWESFEDYSATVQRLSSYLKSDDKRITGGISVELDFKTTVYRIDWIGSMRNTLNQRGDLQENLMQSLQNSFSVDEIIQKLFMDIKGWKAAPNVELLLNPKTYFDVDFAMKNERGDRTSGSNGQIYAQLVLLGMARLALFESGSRSNRKRGLRIMPIDEAASLGSNYEMLTKLAESEGYQIVSLSILPVNTAEEGQIYSYTLNAGTGEINQPAFGYFGHSGLPANLRSLLPDTVHEEIYDN